MATITLRQFSHLSILKSIRSDRLVSFLNPHGEYFGSRGLDLSTEDSDGGIDHQTLLSILMAPRHDTPTSLATALYIVDELATHEGMDRILEAATTKGLLLDCGDDPSPADVAVELWLRDRDLAERLHAQQIIPQRRSFEYYRTTVHPVPPLVGPDQEIVSAMTADMDDWFDEHKRGRDSQLFVFSGADLVWFVVRHGEPYRREGGMDVECVVYRPEKYDVLGYDPKCGEIRINAACTGEKKLYRKKFGKHLFGDEGYFPDGVKYTLEPLRADAEQSLDCADIEGIAWVRLREVDYFWGGQYSEVEVRKADDLFACLRERGRSIPERVRLSRAKFEVKFEDAKATRMVTVRPPRSAQYARDSDSAIVEKWLKERSFIIATVVRNEEPQVLASA